tara:strand:- start:208 stop:408 length:201 start_codon:yes stop_codon:yes gene_type:complete
MVNIPQLIQQYKDSLLNPNEQIELVQVLLDTELLTEYPEMDKLANYFISEGLCYYIPIDIMPELKE